MFQNSKFRRTALISLFASRFGFTGYGLPRTQ